MKILITGVGGDIGNGVCRILRDSGVAAKIIGCDVHERHIGRTLCDEFRVVPRADAPGYLEAVTAIVREYAPDVVLPTSEGELRFLFRSGSLSDLAGVPLIMANRQALEVGFDKLRTAAFLQSHGLPFPWTRLVDSEEPERLPCLVKSRTGAGSKDIRRVDDPSLIEVHRRLSPGYIWQEYLGSADSEYTCGVFRAGADDVRVIAFRRWLTGGMTTYGEVVENPQIDGLCHAIAEAVGLEGSINVQLRLTDRGPVVFEINPRFSSTVVFRHLLGFSDVLWSIARRRTGTVPAYDRPAKSGTRIFRTFGEMIQR
jgi:carbamoyl-phosphate synthase large subunit